jgi:hypothetical protein
MKGIRVMAAMLAAVACLAGCRTLIEAGVSEAVLIQRAQTALADEGLAGSVTDSQIQRVIDGVKANPDFEAVALEILQDPKIAALVQKALEKELKK